MNDLYPKQAAGSEPLQGERPGRHPGAADFYERSQYISLNPEWNGNISLAPFVGSQEKTVPPSPTANTTLDEGKCRISTAVSFSMSSRVIAYRLVAFKFTESRCFSPSMCVELKVRTPRTASN